MQPLVLLHGAIGASSQLASIAAAFPEKKILCPDLSGHGQAPFAGSFSIEGFAKEVLGYMDSRGIGKADFFGYSMGGYIALHLAATCPERVGKIITLATKFAWSPEIAASEVRMLNASKIEEKLPDFARTLQERHGDWKQVLQNTATMMLELGEEQPLKPEVLDGIQQKVLLMAGDRDRMVSLEETIAAYRQLPAAALCVLPHTPHPIEQMDTQLIVEQMIRFLTAD
ncbi:MAG: alpha/beta fold hydrolase [Sphingobacteriales bacterium]|nr:MAG: alpha/beta fold hydrolase [Sphingobacteriales bacterium]